VFLQGKGSTAARQVWWSVSWMPPRHCHTCEELPCVLVTSPPWQKQHQQHQSCTCNEVAVVNASHMHTRPGFTAIFERNLFYLMVLLVVTMFVLCFKKGSQHF